MPIKFIELFSNTINPRKFKPTISIEENSISICADTFFSDGYWYTLDESVDIQVEIYQEESYLNVYFVEEISTKELIIVVDHLKKSEIGSRWEPNPELHRILFNPINGFIPENSTNLEGGNIYVYSMDFVKEFKEING